MVELMLILCIAISRELKVCQGKHIKRGNLGIFFIVSNCLINDIMHLMQIKLVGRWVDIMLAS